MILFQPRSINERGKIMSKGRDSRRGSKKEPAKTMKEKKADKRIKKDEKKNENKGLGILKQ